MCTHHVTGQTTNVAAVTDKNSPVYKCTHRQGVHIIESLDDA